MAQEGSNDKSGAGSKMMRLQKYVAACGVSSRREAEALIAQGRLKVNGLVVERQGFMVDPEQDSVSLDGKELKPMAFQTIAFHKPANCLCSRSDPRGRPTVFEFLPKEVAHLNYVGRLDFDTTGLLLLTSDGELGRRLTLPEFGIRRVYTAHVEGRISDDALKKMERGVELEGERLTARRAVRKRQTETASIVEVTLTEGRNREVKRLVEAVGHRVFRLERIRFAEIALSDLPRGMWRQLSREELMHLYTLVNLR